MARWMLLAYLWLVAISMSRSTWAFQPLTLTSSTLPHSLSLNSASAVRRSFPTRSTGSTVRSISSRSSKLYSVSTSIAPRDEESPSSSSKATISNEVFNLVKGIVGAGVLTLPGGIATFGNAPSAVIPAVLLIAAIGTMSGYGFALIGRVCALTSTTSYRSAWEASVSPTTSWIPAVSVTFKTLCAVLAYSMILGDTFHALALSAGITASKTAILCTITGTVLLPLCLLKNLSSLAPFSLLGSLGMVFTAIAMAVRYFGKAYAPGGAFALDLPANLRPAFGTTGAAGVFSPVTSILLGMLSTAYMAHFNAPKFYTELRSPSVPRYLTVVSTSFGISITIFAVIAALGFLTFGTPHYFSWNDEA